ncbi:MAG: hypothetical protein AAGA74_03670 [Pseudomonadota bacterium]
MRANLAAGATELPQNPVDAVYLRFQRRHNSPIGSDIVSAESHIGYSAWYAKIRSTV